MTARKKAIMREATRLFAEKGYDAVPVSEIARQAEVSEGAIFRHFKSKQDLLHSIFVNIRETFYADLEAGFRFSAGEPGLDMVMRLIRLYCHFYESRETEFDFIHRNNPYQMPDIGVPCREEIQRIHDKMAELLRIGLSLGVRDGSIRALRVDETALLILGLISGAVRFRLFQKLHLEDLEAELLDFAVNALRA